MHQQDMTLMAHLMRRAGFGATRDDLEPCVAKGYGAVVEELLHPSDPQAMPEDIIRRYHVDQSELRQLDLRSSSPPTLMSGRREPSRISSRTCLLTSTRHTIFLPRRSRISGDPCRSSSIGRIRSTSLKLIVTVCRFTRKPKGLFL
jgi:hypothetical protein